MKTVFLGIGTNLGDREENLKKSLRIISETIGKITAVSSVYETEPWGFESGNLFLNMVVQIETKLTPRVLLKRIMMTEAVMGRIREGKEYSSRLIDIDILFYDDIVTDLPELKIPHPRIPERRFVLVPLCELVPNFVHPVLKKTMAQMLAECPDHKMVKLYKGFTTS